MVEYWLDKHEAMIAVLEQCWVEMLILSERFIRSPALGDALGSASEKVFLRKRRGARPESHV